jgi:peptidoglycan/LPS O-acetylase OafA/YrhL
LLVHVLDQTFERGGLKLSDSQVARLFYLTDVGGRGVLLFFAISGFILAQPFLRQHLQAGKRVSIAGYFKRRLTRLEPPYILSLLIYSMAMLAYHHPVPTLIAPLLAHLFYVHNLFPGMEPVNFVAWSLEVEVQFYILAPVLGLLYVIRSTWTRRGVMIALIITSAIVKDQTTGVLQISLPGQLQFFMVGFLLADLRATRTESSTKWWWDAVSIAVWVMLFGMSRQIAPYTTAPLILLACLATFNGPVTRRFFRTEWIAITGGMCYSFYLMHMLVIMTAFKLTKRLILPDHFVATYLIQAVLLLPLVAAVSTLYYAWIERPCMDPKWPNRLAAHLRQRATGRKEAAIAPR